MPRKLCAGLLLAVVMLAMVPAAAAPDLPTYNLGWPDVFLPPKPADQDRILKAGWASARDAIGDALAQAYRPGTAMVIGSTRQANFKSWLLLWRWCNLLAEGELASAERFLARHVVINPTTNSFNVVAPGRPVNLEKTVLPELLHDLLQDSENPSALLTTLLAAGTPPPGDGLLADLLPADLQKEWLRDPDFLRLVLDTLAPGDYAPAVLRSLVSIRQAQPARFRGYRALAVAIAVVCDEKLPPSWPHGQVAKDKLPLQNYPAADWFSVWVRINEAPGQLTDLRTLTPELLKFVVDAPLAESEFDWARKNVRFAREHFAQVFSSIKYVKQRETDHVLQWPGGPYTLAAIKQSGGICVDQAYFSAIAGKALGLPTLFFTGQGTDGGHAWFGYLQAGDQWDLDCGRYLNQKFVVGHALDPQTWLPINDHELRFLAAQFHRRPEYSGSQDDLVMAGIFEAQDDPGRAARALTSAIIACPENPDAWDAKTSFLERTDAPVAALRAHHQAALSQFNGVPDISAAHLRALAALAAKAGDSARAGALENLIAVQNLGSRPDLTVDVVAKKIKVLLAGEKMAEATREFQDLLNALGKNAGGKFYYQIARPLVAALLRSGDNVPALNALAVTRRTLNPSKGSILDQDIGRLEARVNASATAKPGL